MPLAYVEEAGDPYKAEMEECVELIMEELEKRRFYNSFTLAYQVVLLKFSISVNGFYFYSVILIVGVPWDLCTE